MKKSHLLGAVCAMALAVSVTQAATIAITPTNDTAPANGTVNFDIVGSDFSMVDGSFDLMWDSSILTYNGDFAFDALLTRSAFFDVIDLQAPGLLTIGWTTGFGPALVFPVSPETRTIGSLSFTINATANDGDFSNLTMVDSTKGASFADEAFNPIAMEYVGARATTVVPVPAAVWLFGSGLLGLVGIARHKKS